MEYHSATKNNWQTREDPKAFFLLCNTPEATGKWTKTLACNPDDTSSDLRTHGKHKHRGKVGSGDSESQRKQRKDPCQQRGRLGLAPQAIPRHLSRTTGRLGQTAKAILWPPQRSLSEHFSHRDILSASMSVCGSGEMATGHTGCSPKGPSSTPSTYMAATIYCCLR